MGFTSGMAETTKNVAGYWVVYIYVIYIYNVAQCVSGLTGVFVTAGNYLGCG